MSVPGAAAVLLLVGLAPAPPEQGTPATAAEIVQRILELQQEIETLLEQLPPEIQAEVHRRLAEASASSSTAVRDESPVAEAVPTVPMAEGTANAVAPEGNDAAPPSAAGDRRRTAAPPSHQSPFGAASPASTTPEVPAVEAVNEPSTPRCNTLLAFDDDGDGSVSAADRLWRHLYLWIDANGDGVLAEREVRHLYDLDVRAVDLDLDRYTDERGLSGDIRVRQGAIRFQLVSSRHSEEATLIADASGLARSGELELLSPSAAPLEGYQPFAPGLLLRSASGTVTLDCP